MPVTNEIVRALEDGAERTGKAAGKDFAEAYQKVLKETGDKVEQSVKNHVENEGKVAKEFEGITKDGEQGLGKDAEAATARDAESGAEHTEPPASGSGGGGRTGDTAPSATEPERPPSSAINNPDGVPGANGNTQRLGTLDEDRVTRTGGLITEIDGKPVKQYANDLGEERRKVYQQAKADGTLSGKAQGQCVAVGVDRRTGNVYEGINGRRNDVIPGSQVHPTVQHNVDTMRANGPYSWAEGEPPTHEYPHPDNPLGHAEVKTTNAALWDRTNSGQPDGTSALGEITQSPQFQFIGGGRPAPFCANCNGTLDGVDSATGRFTGYPATDDNFVP
jgi:hypothetical protein